MMMIIIVIFIAMLFIFAKMMLVSRTCGIGLNKQQT